MTVSELENTLDLSEPEPRLISVEGLSVEFGTADKPVPIVTDVSFEIRSGETVCVVGESGSGKSITALSLMRLVEFGGGRISAGKLRFMASQGNEIDLAALDQITMRSIRGSDIAMIFQDPMNSLNPVLTIGSQLADGLMAHLGMSSNEAYARAIELLNEVRIPEPERRLKQYPHELSGGMRQRVVIAMAMACEPKLLIADEPTTALDVTIEAEILSLIDRLKRKTGMAVLFITHDMGVVAQIANRVIVMYRGSIVEQGTVNQIFEAPKAEYTKSLLASVPTLGSQRGRPPSTLTEEQGKTLLNDSYSTNVLEVRNLTTRFGVRGSLLRRQVAQVHAVEDVSFSVAAGETLALVGESGSGKSTCGRSILRLTEPAAGKIIFCGEDIRAKSKTELRNARRDMQMVFQDPFSSLNPSRRLRDQVAEPLLNFSMASGQDLEDRLADLFDKVELPRDFLRRFPHELSGGQRQRVAIARAIATNPKLIVADEAVSALDVSVQAQIVDLILKLQAESGVSFIFISHDMAVVEKVSHRIGVMYQGRIVELGPRDLVLGVPQHPYTRRLLNAVPIPDPRHRRSASSVDFTPMPSPVFPLGHAVAPSSYEEVSPGHLVLVNDPSAGSVP